MASPLTLIIVLCGIISAVAFILYSFGINVTQDQIIMVAILFIVTFVLIIVGKFVLNWRPKMQKGKTISETKKFIENWWINDMGMTDSLTLRGVKMKVGYTTGGEKIVGFTIRRSKGERAGQKMVVICTTSPIDVIYLNELPSPEELKNPFFTFKRDGFTILPSKTISPESEIGYWRYRSPRGQPLIEQRISGRERDEFEDFVKGKKK